MKDTKQIRPNPVIQSEPRGRTVGGRMSRDVQAKIGQQLQAMYQEVVNQGVPDRFADLLRQLDDKDIKGSHE